MPRHLLPVSLLLLFLLNGCHSVPENIAPLPGYEEIAQHLKDAIHYEMRDKGIPGFSIALVDSERIVWAQGFGTAHPATGEPATAQTVYRVASISKLFTALAVMQQVELGVLDLDVDIRNYLPAFHPKNPFDRPITLRQLLSHRSGLVREPPVGNYFDPSQPSLLQTVYSLNDTRLVYSPETRTKYSNAAVSVAGFVVEKVNRQPFGEYVQQTLLEPMNMRNSSFFPLARLREQLATGYMWTYDGRTFEAPVFELGILPAANLYTTVTDLGSFLITLFRRGKTEGRRPILSPELLEQMWTIQYAQPGQEAGFGLGFYLSRFRGYRRFQHSGVMYGYASRIYGLPDVQLGVAAVSTLDATNVVTDRLSEYALDLLLAHRNGQPLPPYPRTMAVDSLQTRRLDGRYVDGRTLDFIERNGNLLVWDGVERNRVKQRNDTLILDGRLSYGRRWFVQGNVLQEIGGSSLHRIEPSLPQASPPRWKAYIGEYGWPHNVLYILEQDGKLYTLIEWFFYYPLEERGPDHFRMPDWGLYMGEEVIFQHDSTGAISGVRIGGVFWKRRRISPEEGQIFRITPVRPIEEIRKEALQAQPPPEEGPFAPVELVDIQRIDSTIKQDIRYATEHNFMGVPLYKVARAFLQRPAAEALGRAHRALHRYGLGIVVHDAYRPWYVTKMMWEATPDSLKRFVASPARGSRHNRGCAVDVSLYDLRTGQPVEMPSGYDEFSPRAFADYPGGTHRQRWYRERLRDAMEEVGFMVYPWEWWHYDCRNWEQYPILNIPLENLSY